MSPWIDPQWKVGTERGHIANVAAGLKGTSYGILILQCRVVDAQYNTVVPVDVDPVFLVVVVRSSRPSQVRLSSISIHRLDLITVANT